MRARLVELAPVDVHVAEQPSRPAIVLIEQPGALRHGVGRAERGFAVLDPA
jgi:hypothetical protein